MIVKLSIIYLFCFNQFQIFALTNFSPYHTNDSRFYINEFLERFYINKFLERFCINEFLELDEHLESLYNV